jgi:hypothetical protein
MRPFAVVLGGVKSGSRPYKEWDAIEEMLFTQKLAAGRLKIGRRLPTGLPTCPTKSLFQPVVQKSPVGRADGRNITR